MKTYLKTTSLFAFIFSCLLLAVFLNSAPVNAQEEPSDSATVSTEQISTTTETDDKASSIDPKLFEDYFPAKPFLLAKKVGVIVMIIWFVLVIGYYTWAIWFYNVNLGYTAKEWREIEKRVQSAQDRKARGEAYEESDLLMPFDNPYKDETLGLPPGAVRSTLALSLTLAALVMLGIVCYAPEGSTFVQRFQYFITAFEMMIAFYFGSRALSAFKSKEEEPEERFAELGKAPVKEPQG